VFGGDDSQPQQHRTRNRSPRREARESQANDERGGARFIVQKSEEITEILDMNLPFFLDDEPAAESAQAATA
jgi:hypothetical protein